MRHELSPKKLFLKYHANLQIRVLRIQEVGVVQLKKYD